MSDWFDDDDDLAGGGSGGLFVDLPQSGDSAEVVFRGAPVKLRGYWDQGKGHTVDLGAEGQPPPGEKLKIQFKINVYLPDENRTAIMKVNAPTFREVKGFREDEGDAFERLRIKITRDGTGKATRYRLSGRGYLTDSQVADMQAQPLHDLVAS